MCQNMDGIRQNVQKIVEKHQGISGNLIEILADVQGVYRYLPEAALQLVAQFTGRSLVDIYAVATFYKHFTLKPSGKHVVSVCTGTACHVRGSLGVASRFERELGVHAEQTTSDGQFTLKTVNCLGACAMGPIAVVDGRYFSNVQENEVKDIIDKSRFGFDRLDVGSDGRVFPIGVSCFHCNHSLMDNEVLVDGFPSIKLTISFNSRHGWIRLSSLYGSHTIESEFAIPTDMIVDFFCPYCHAQIVGGMSCLECGAPMIPMSVGGGGIVQICSRATCKGHLLDLGSRKSEQSMDRN